MIYKAPDACIQGAFDVYIKFIEGRNFQTNSNPGKDLPPQNDL